MQHLHDLNASDLSSLSPETVAALAQQMLVTSDSRPSTERQTHESKFKDTKLEKVMFELARLKTWKFDARTEAMNAGQLCLFEKTMTEDEASLQAQLEQLQSKLPAKQAQEEGDKSARTPRR